MLNKHKNHFLQVLVSEGYRPEDFTARMHKLDTGDTFFCVALKAQDKIFFHIKSVESSFDKFCGEYGTFSPTFKKTAYPILTETPLKVGEATKGQATKIFATWLERHAGGFLRDQATTDLWSEAAAALKGLENGAFTRDDEIAWTEVEKLRMRKAIGVFRELIVTKHRPSEDTLQIIDQRLEYLSQSLDRLNKFDWKAVAVATTIGIATALSLDTNTGRELWSLLQQAMSNVLLLPAP